PVLRNGFAQSSRRLFRSMATLGGGRSMDFVWPFLFLALFAALLGPLYGQGRETKKLMWSLDALHRRVGLVVSHFKLDEGLANWQKLALDPSSSKIHVIKAYMDETGSSLGDADRAVRNWLGQR